MDQEFGKDSHVGGSDLGAVVQCSQVVARARAAGGRSSSGIFLFTSPWSISLWSLAEAGLHFLTAWLPTVLGLFHGSSELPTTGESCDDL